MKPLNKIKLAAAAFFHGMKGGEELITKSNDSTSKVQEIGGSGVFKDFIEEKETDEVQEMRDKYYRVLREADKYLVTVTGFEKPKGDEDEKDLPEDAMLLASAVKKDPINLNTKEDILQTKGYKVLVIQDAKDFELGLDSQFEHLGELMRGIEVGSIETIIFKIDRDFTPKFLIEKYIRKAVIKRNEKDNTYLLDLYFSIYARQFWKIDSLFIAELKRVYDEQNKRNEMFDFKTLSFTTRKAAGEQELQDIKCTNKGLSKVEIFDGNYVVELNIDYESTDATDKYKTDELSEKYLREAPKSKTADAVVMDKLMKEAEMQNIIRNSKTE
jgi:hypothetical protein